MKSKSVRANNSPFMNTTLSKDIMTRSRLKNKFQSNPTTENKSNYNRQRNYCVNLNKTIKKAYYSNLNIKDINDNKKFWDVIKPCFSDKNTSKKKIVLIDENIIITDEEKIAKTMNDYFSEGGGANMHENDNDIIKTSEVNDIIAKFENHPSIIKIKENVTHATKFSFSIFHFLMK